MKQHLTMRLCQSVAFMGMLATNSAAARAPNANEYWISPTPSSNGVGTITNPWDGSDQHRFDDHINHHLPPNSTLHILPGTYQTKGVALPSGAQVLGSGIDVTILRLMADAADDSAVIESRVVPVYDVSNIVVSDLTCVCPDSPSKVHHGVILHGTQHTIRRVKLTNQAMHSTYTNRESMGLFVSNSTLRSSIGNIIEECEVSQFQGGFPGRQAFINGIGFGNAVTNVPRPIGVIRHNRVIGTRPLANASVNAIWLASNSLIEGNYVEGVACASHNEGAITNVLFINNTLKDCALGIDLVGSRYQGLTFAYNQIVAKNRAIGSFHLEPTGAHNIAICGNKIELQPQASAIYCISATNVTGLIVANNTVDSRMSDIRLGNCVDVHLDGNYDFYGNYLWGAHAPAHKWAASMPIKAAPGSSGVKFGRAPDPQLLDAALVTHSACGLLWGVVPHGLGFSNIVSTIDLEGDANTPPTTVYAQLALCRGMNILEAPRLSALVKPGQITSITFTNLTGWSDDTAGRQIRVGLFDHEYGSRGPDHNVWIVGWTAHSVE
jgi:hypothetical protein